MATRDDSEWLTLGQAARFLGVAQSTIRKWSDSGRVPAFYTPGGHRRYRRTDLEAFLDRSGPGGRPKAGPGFRATARPSSPLRRRRAPAHDGTTTGWRMRSLSPVMASSNQGCAARISNSIWAGSRSGNSAFG